MDIGSVIDLEPNPNIPQLEPGDLVRVSTKIVEAGRERIQVFEGTIIRVRKGKASANFTVRRITHGVGVERTFLLHSPLVEKVDIVRRGQVRRAKLYYLRGLTGKAARVKERTTRNKGGVEKV